MPVQSLSLQNARSSGQAVVASPAGQPSPGLEEDDLILIRRVAAHDRQAFEILYHRYAPRLSRYLSTLLRPRELVEEVCDDVMLVVWQSAARFNHTSRLSTWIFGIAHYKALKARALATLPPDQRAVVELTLAHDCSYQEIAEITGCPVNTVKTRMFHARRHLAQLAAVQELRGPRGAQEGPG